MIDIVPQNIESNLIPREHFIQFHVTEFANALYNVEENTLKTIVYIDGAYSIEVTFRLLDTHIVYTKIDIC